LYSIVRSRCRDTAGGTDGLGKSQKTILQMSLKCRNTVAELNANTQCSDGWQKKDITQKAQTASFHYESEK